jgi:hypothetical protein
MSNTRVLPSRPLKTRNWPFRETASSNSNADFLPEGRVLIGDATIPEEHEAALLALVDEWDSGDA